MHDMEMLQVMMEFETMPLTDEAIDTFFDAINNIQNSKNNKIHNENLNFKDIFEQNLIYINARSLLKNLEEIEILVVKYKPILLLCSETRVTDEINRNEYSMQGYISIECLSENRHTGGVVMYIRKDTKYKVILNYTKNKMLWFLSVEIWDSEINGIFSVFYRSPSNLNNIEESLNELDELFGKVISLNKLNIIVGDLNIDLLKDDKFSRLANCSFIKNGLDLNNKFVTRENENNGTLIDVVLTNEMNMIKSKPLEKEIISDHKTIMINILHEDLMNKNKKLSIISWRNYSKESLIENLRKCNWSGFDEMDINSKLKLLRENLVNSVRPLTSKIEIKNDVKPKKWFDEETRTKKKEKIEKYLKWQNNGKQIIDKQQYTQSRNEYNKLIKSKKANYFKAEVRESSNNQNKMWKLLKSLISNKMDNACEEIIFENEKITDTKLISNKFNEYFVDSITELNGQINDVNNGYFELINNSNYSSDNNEFKLRTITVEEIFDTAKFLKRKINRSTHCNSLVWHDAMDYIAHFMKTLINEIILNGILPDEWKISTVTPIPKIKNTNKADTFRPINAMECDEKFLETIVKSQLVEYIENNKLLAKNQSAFRKNHSCETALTYVISDWRDSLSEGRAIVVVFLDLKRAFETVDRKRMLEKLKSYGIKNSELKLFENYLYNRKQKVKFKDEMSDEVDVPIGLPQGTALSVILFILYINDIVSVPRKCKISLFADDTTLIGEDETTNGAINKVNEDLERIFDWLNTNKLILNISKTKWMLLARGSNCDNANMNYVKINGMNIERVNCIKYLGVHIDDHLKFDNQIVELVKKTAPKINVLKRISKKLTFDTRKIIYYSIIAPNFEYCSTLYMACSNAQLNEIQKLQNRAMRIILNCEYGTPRVFMLNALDWLSISQKIKLNTLIMIYKMKNAMLPDYLSEKIKYNSDTHSINTRYRNNFRLPRVNSEMAKRSIYYEGLKMYNELPNYIKESVTLAQFKKNCAKYVKQTFEPLN